MFGCSRVKLYIPTHNLLISFALTGLRTPNRDSPLAALGLAATNAKCNQRDVIVEIEGLDKGDNFLGNLFVDGANLAVHLVKQGLASLHGPRLVFSPLDPLFNTPLPPFKPPFYKSPQRRPLQVRGRAEGGRRGGQGSPVGSLEGLRCSWRRGRRRDGR